MLLVLGKGLLVLVALVAGPVYYIWSSARLERWLEKVYADANEWEKPTCRSTTVGLLGCITCSFRL